MGRNPTFGFKVKAPPIEPLHVVAGDLFRPVLELAHAPEPLRSIREIVCSSSYKFAARRYKVEMESAGLNSKIIEQKMKEETPFTLFRIVSEFAELPPGAALTAKSEDQLRICTNALAMARRGDVEGFLLDEPSGGWQRHLLLPFALREAVEVIECNYFVPNHLLPAQSDELFGYGP